MKSINMKVLFLCSSLVLIFLSIIEYVWQCDRQTSNQNLLCRYNQKALNIIKYSSSDEIELQRLSKIKVAIIDEGITKQLNINFVKLRTSQYTESSHGSVIANLLTAHFDNNTGYQGLIPNMPLYGYSLSSDEMNIFSLAEAIKTVIRWKVDIISISMGTNKGDKELENVVLDAVKHGIVVICSAGNNPYEMNYPASFNIPGVISVGAVGNDCNILPDTNVNMQTDIYAPGENIASFKDDAELIKEYTGTSVAVPFVTLACIFIKAYSNSLNPKEVEKFLKQNTDYHLVYWKNEQMEIKILDMEQLKKLLKS